MPELQKQISIPLENLKRVQSTAENAFKVLRAITADPKGEELFFKYNDVMTRPGVLSELTALTTYIDELLNNKVFP